MLKVNNDKYTASVYTLINNDFNIFNFNYPLKQKYKKYFESCFINEFMWNEINFHMPGQWQQRIKKHLMINSYKYNDLLDNVQRKFDPLVNNVIKNMSKMNNKRIVRNLYESVLQGEDSNMLTENVIGSNNDDFNGSINETGREIKTGTDSENRSGTNNQVKNTVGELIKSTNETIIDDKTGKKDTTGESIRTVNLDETTNNTSVHRVADTPQNNMDVLGGSNEINTQPQGTQLFAQYLSSIEDTRTNGTHHADTNEKINNTENITTEDHDKITKTGGGKDDSTSNETINTIETGTKTGNFGHEINKTGVETQVNSEVGNFKQDKVDNTKFETERVNQGYNNFYNKTGGEQLTEITGINGVGYIDLLNNYKNKLFSAMEVILRDFDQYFLGIIY